MWVSVVGCVVVWLAGGWVVGCLLLAASGCGQSPYKILDFRGFDSSRILSLSGGILMSIGNFPESLNQRILAGIILGGRL